MKQNHNLTEYMVYVGTEHPRATKDGRVRAYMLEVEKYHNRFDPKFFTEINGKFFLKDKLITGETVVVHHIDLNHSNNNIDNLMVMTKNEHTALHDRLRSNKSQNKTGVNKSGNIGEDCDVNTEITKNPKSS